MRNPKCLAITLAIFLCMTSCGNTAPADNGGTVSGSGKVTESSSREESESSSRKETTAPESSAAETSAGSGKLDGLLFSEADSTGSSDSSSGESSSAEQQVQLPGNGVSFYETLYLEYQKKPLMEHLNSWFYQSEIDNVTYKYGFVKDGKPLYRTSDSNYDQTSYFAGEGEYDLCVLSYDIENEQYRQIPLISYFNGNVFDIVLYDGAFYASVCEKSDSGEKIYKLIKYDLDGNMLYTKILPEAQYISFISENGDVLLDNKKLDLFEYRNLDKEGDYYLIDSVIDNPKPFSFKLNVPGAHGIEQEFEFKPFAVYNNEIYAYSIINNERKIYKYDLTSGNWNEAGYSVPDDSYYFGSVIGKYAWCSRRNDEYNDKDCDAAIFDLETGKVIAKINDVFRGYMDNNYRYLTDVYAKLFKYESSMLCVNKRWVRLRCADDGSTDYTLVEKMGHQGLENYTYTRVSRDYYIFWDQYGEFLRSFSDGDDESKEKTIMLR